MGARQAGMLSVGEVPIKRPVRIADGLDVGDVATVTVELVDFT